MLIFVTKEKKILKFLPKYADIKRVKDYRHIRYEKMELKPK